MRLPLSLLLLLLAAPGARAEGLAGAALVESVIEKLEYDRTYFTNVVRAEGQGRQLPGMSRSKLEREARRGAQNLPVLERFFEQLPRYRAGEPLALPGDDETYRVYTNLIAILNVVQAIGHEDWTSALHFGGKVMVSDRESLGQVRGARADYYVQLYRELFFLMANASYHAGRDADAVRWLARLEADADLQALRQSVQLETADADDSRFARLEKLRAQPLAVMAFENLTGDEQLAWLGRGLAEVFASELGQLTDLFVVERTQLARMLQEAKLEQLGITDGRFVTELRKVMAAGTVLVGSYARSASGLQLTARLVNVADGQVLAAGAGEVPQDEPFAPARDVLLGLFEPLGWIEPPVEAELRAARAPAAGVVRDLMHAKVLAGTRAEEAKALYAKAMREDPVLARRFDELRTEFADVSATVAVMPFLNVSGDPADEWLGGGAAEALATDLPKLKLNVVERGQLAAVLREHEQREIRDTAGAVALGKQVGADLVVLGSVLHQGAHVRVDARFVEIRTGVVLLAASGESRSGDFMAALVGLVGEIAARLNDNLDEHTLAELAGKKMSQVELEDYVRQQLAREALPRSPDGAPGASAEPGAEGHAGRWIAAGVSAVSAGAMLVSVLQAATYGENAAYYDALQQVAPDGAARLDLADQRDAEAGHAQLWSLAGIGAAAAGTAALAYLLWDVLAEPEADTHVSVGPGGVVLSF